MLQLVTAVEKPSFEQFYQDNHARVVQYINKKLGNYHDAEDLAETVFVYCYEHYDTLDPTKSSPTTWLYMIVNSRLKNHYRDAKTYVDFESVVGVLSDDSVDMDAAIYLEQMQSGLKKALAKLPARQQQIVYMRYFEDRSAAEIAKALNLTAGNVRVILSRALDQLSGLCADFLE